MYLWVREQQFLPEKNTEINWRLMGLNGCIMYTYHLFHLEFFFLVYSPFRSLGVE
jgi:hypothetical protein